MSSPPGPVSDLCVSVAHLRSLRGDIASQIASQISPGLACEEIPSRCREYDSKPERACQLQNHD